MSDGQLSPGIIFPLSSLVMNFSVIHLLTMRWAALGDEKPRSSESSRKLGMRLRLVKKVMSFCWDGSGDIEVTSN